MAGRANAIGAITAQFAQALGSFLLHILALRLMGLEGLGSFALLFGVIVLATSVVSGLVGDSLTVLDRADPGVRSGLQTWLVVASLVVAVVPAVGSWMFGVLTGVQVVLFAGLIVAFVVEDTMRRLLMACLRFWSLVIVDTSAILVSVGLVAAVRLGRGSVTLTTFLVAVLVGQTVATVVAASRLPSTERWLAVGVAPDAAAVWRYGSWRAAQQMLRPTMLATVRGLVTVSAGLAAFGELEAARVYVAPAMLVVGGVVSFLFASYARDRTSPLGQMRRRADRAVARLGAITVAIGIVATVSAPRLGSLLTTSEYDLSPFAVFGWSMFTASVAAVTPYGALAAVRGRQALVLAIRSTESLVTVVLVGVLVGVGTSIFAVPLLLAVVSLVSGVAIRLLLLRDPVEEACPAIDPKLPPARP